MVIIHCKLLPEGMNDPDPILDQRVAVPSVELLIQLAGKSTEVRIRHIWARLTHILYLQAGHHHFYVCWCLKLVH